MADDFTQLLKTIETDQAQNPNAQLAVITVYQWLIKCIMELLSFLEKSFYRYFNPDEKIPQIYNQLLQSEFTVGLTGLINLNTAKKNRSRTRRHYAGAIQEIRQYHTVLIRHIQGGPLHAKTTKGIFENMDSLAR